MCIKILEVIQQHTGSVLKNGRLQRAQNLLITLEQEGYTHRQLLDLLQQEPYQSDMWQRVIQHLTVGETYFFRNRPHFEALRTKILPQVINRRRQLNQKYLRIWVTGCATGEEPYSVAMLLRQLLPDIAEWSVFLLATDINVSFLSIAKAGVYRERSFRSETPDDVRWRWFDREGTTYRIKPEIRQMVTFGSLNLIKDVYPLLQNNTTSLDLIFCRNVTIYFDRSTTQTIVDRFYRSLAPEGWLFVGHSEPQPHVYERFTMHNINGAIVYKKLATQQAASIKPTVPIQSMPPIDTISASESPLQTRKPETETDLLAAAQLAADKEDWQTSLQLLEQAEQNLPFDSMLHYIRGMVFTHMDRPQDAIRAFRQAVYCSPQFALAYYALGELHHQLGDTRAAKSNWRRAMKAVQAQPPGELVMGGADLTAEMLSELLAFRLA